MIIHISEALSAPNKIISYEVPIELDAFLMDGKRYPIVSKDPVTLTVTNKGKKVVSMVGRIRLVLEIPCDRCLRPVDTEFRFDIDEEIDFKKSDEDRIRDLNETSYMDQGSLDVDALVSTEILIGFPMKTLCREDCKGICPVCGQNLNLGECGCDRTPVDLQMSAIRDIFKNFKEV